MLLQTSILVLGLFPMIELYSSIMALFHTWWFAASLYVEYSASMILLIRPDYFWGSLLSLKVLEGALSFSASCNVSRAQAGLLLEGGALRNSSSCLFYFMGAFDNEGSSSSSR